MTKYKSWQAPIYAFFSTQFYREVGCNGKGVGFLYLFVVLALACAIPQIKSAKMLHDRTLSFGSQIVNQVPEININNGRLSINRESPSFISNPSNGDYLMAFDTSGANLISPELNVPVIIRAEGFTRDDGAFTSFHGINDVHLSSKELMHWLRVVSFGTPIALYLFGVAVDWVLLVIQAFGLSLAGLALAKAVGINIKYEGILRITCLALGNVVILDGIVNMFPIEFPGLGSMEFSLPNWFLYKFGIALGYTLFGVGANLSQPGFQSVSDESPADEKSL